MAISSMAMMNIMTNALVNASNTGNNMYNDGNATLATLATILTVITIMTTALIITMMIRRRE